MSSTVKIYALMILMLGSACALVVTSLGNVGQTAANVTVVYKDPQGKWPDGSDGPASGKAGSGLDLAMENRPASKPQGWWI